MILKNLKTLKVPPVGQPKIFFFILRVYISSYLYTIKWRCFGNNFIGSTRNPVETNENQ